MSLPNLCFQGTSFAASLLAYSFYPGMPGQVQLVPGGPDAAGFVIGLN